MTRRKKDFYKSFLLRIWCDEISQIRRVVVTHINKNGEQEHFSTIDELMIFLLHEIDSSPGDGGETPECTN